MSQGKIEERIRWLRDLARTGPEAEVLPVLGRALRDRASLLVAGAARLTAEGGHAVLVPDLLQAFDRLFQNPVRSDPKCWGKTAIVRALAALEYDQSPPFVRGSGHVQMEAVWGGREDTAAELRASSFLALAACTDIGRGEILRRLVDAMTDAADPVRLEVVRAVAGMGGDEAALLLRLKARMGDGRPRVTGQVFDAVLGVESERGLGFVAGYLAAAAPETRDEAAFALGASRMPGAIDRLIATAKETADPEFRGVLLRALSASGRPPAIDFLLDLVRNGPERDARLALDALGLHDASPEIREQVEAARKTRSRTPEP